MVFFVPCTWGAPVQCFFTSNCNKFHSPIVCFFHVFCSQMGHSVIWLALKHQLTQALCTNVCLQFWAWVWLDAVHAHLAGIDDFFIKPVWLSVALFMPHNDTLSTNENGYNVHTWQNFYRGVYKWYYPGLRKTCLSFCDYVYITGISHLNIKLHQLSAIYKETLSVMQAILADIKGAFSLHAPFLCSMHSWTFRYYYLENPVQHFKKMYLYNDYTCFVTATFQFYLWWFDTK